MQSLMLRALPPPAPAPPRGPQAAPLRPALQVGSAGADARRRARGPGRLAPRKPGIRVALSSAAWAPGSVVGREAPSAPVPRCGALLFCPLPSQPCRPGSGGGTGGGGRQLACRDGLVRAVLGPATGSRARPESGEAAAAPRAPPPPLRARVGPGGLSSRPPSSRQLPASCTPRGWPPSRCPQSVSPGGAQGHLPGAAGGGPRGPGRPPHPCRRDSRSGRREGRRPQWGIRQGGRRGPALSQRGVAGATAASWASRLRLGSPVQPSRGGPGGVQCSRQQASPAGGAWGPHQAVPTPDILPSLQGGVRRRAAGTGSRPVSPGATWSWSSRQGLVGNAGGESQAVVPGPRTLRSTREHGDSGATGERRVLSHPECKPSCGRMGVGWGGGGGAELEGGRQQ